MIIRKNYHLGISDFSKTTKREFLEKYPRPSGAELAAKEICRAFPETKGSLVDRLIETNKSVKREKELLKNLEEYQDKFIILSKKDIDKL